MINLFNLVYKDTYSLFKSIYLYFFWNLNGVAIDFSCKISKKCKIEKNCIFTGNTLISLSQIGSYSYGHNLNIKNAIIGNYVSIGPDVKIGLDEHRLDCFSTHPSFYEPVTQKTTTIKDHVWIGTNSVILSGVTIGEHSIIAAGAVVTCDVPPYTIYGGIPAKFIKNRKTEKI